MADAYHDNNHTSTLIGLLSTDGATITNVKADAATHALNVSDGTTGTDHGPANSLHDGSHVPVLMATSNADGKTPVAVYVDSNGNLLIDSV